MSTQRWEEKSAPVLGGEKETERERETQPFAFSFYMFPAPGLPYVNWVNQECCLFYLRSSLWSSGLPLFYFLGLPYLLATAILDSFSLF